MDGYGSVVMANGKSFSTSSLPLDMKQLKAITGDKGSFQEELLEIFFFNVAECMSAMEHHCTEGESEKWHNATDELKNISYSLGATELAKVCEVAQRNPANSLEEKKRILANIRAHTQRLRAFIRNTRY